MEFKSKGVLSTHFKLDIDNNDVKTYGSIKTSVGRSPRHEAKLWVIFQDDFVEIRWVSELAEDCIFYGNGLKTEEDLVQVLKYLGVYNFVVQK